MREDKTVTNKDILDKESAQFAEHLTENTRTARRNLLIASVIGATVASTGLVPVEISALGIKLTEINQLAFLIIILSCVLYFLVTFCFYVYSDLLRAHWKDLFMLSITFSSDMSPQELEMEEVRQRFFADISKIKSSLRNTHLLGIAVDVGLPTLVALLSIGLLVWALIDPAFGNNKS